MTMSCIPTQQEGVIRLPPLPLTRSVAEPENRTQARVTRVRKMPVRVPVRAELATALALDQAWEASGQPRVLGWAERPARRRLA
jgi:hypothetical protein